LKDFKFIFLRLSFYLILGILSAFYFPVNSRILLISGVFVLVLFLITFIRSRQLIFPDVHFGITSFLLIFYLGFHTTYFSIPKNQPDHFINHQTENNSPTILVANVSEELKPTAFSQRFILETKSLISEEEVIFTHGKLLLNLTTDSSSTSILKPGMQLLIPWTAEEIKAPLNPFQFSYKEYTRQLKIERQISISPLEVKIRNTEPATLSSKSWNIRERLISDLKKHDFGKNEIAIFQALILGQRRDISESLYKNYAAAGAIHILAISGLHIGILLVLLNFLLQELNRFKYGRVIKAILLIALLWSFAILTGLSASVVRAVSMFSFIAIGLQIKRKTSVLNSLFLSLFILLLINPHYIFQVGFQLSYLAVFSIIVFQPFIYGLFKPTIKIIDYLWKLSSVSLAAQIGVIPLSLYYFHQFPGLFLLSNLVILPFLGVILALGIIVIILASINLLPDFLTKLFDLILSLQNEFIKWIAGVETIVFSNIHLSFFQTLSIYLFFLGILFIIIKANYYRVYFLLISILIFQASTIYSEQITPVTEATIFHRSKHSIIGVKERKKLHIYSDKASEIHILDDYIRERYIEEIEIDKLPEIINILDRLTLIIDTTRNYNISNFHPEILILRNSPKVNLERLIDQLLPKQIVADGSNYNSYVNRWRETAANKKIPFHYTGEKGAFIVNFEK